MKILFIVKAIDFIDPIGIMLLSALAKRGGHSTSLGVLTRENILKKIVNLKPDVIAYSGSTGEHKYYLAINKTIKSKFKNLFTIMGGPHTTFYPECFEESTLDAICIGEGDEAFVEVLNALEQGKRMDGIKNIVTRCGDQSGLRELYQDLDSLPFPDRSLYYENTEMGRFPLKSFMASRGCPYPCTYCFNHAFKELYKGKGRIIRRHSVDYLIEEILRVKDRYPLECVKFYDDIFVYQVDEWLEEFVNGYKGKVRLPFHCLTRCDLMTGDMAKLLKEAGCYSISMSIEAGNPDFRNGLLRRNMSNEQIIKAFEICSHAGIKTFSNNIVGLPHAKIENELETVELNLRCKVSFAEFPIFHPYPKTELGNYCIEKGIYHSSYESLHMSYMNKSPLTCFTEKEKDVQKNLSELGTVVVGFPILKKIILNHLIYWPSNGLFFLAYFFSKAYLVKTKVYPFKLGLRNLWDQFLKSINLERFKHSDESIRNS
jgi:anaerobic magnesium-protoporphyrin IX monomethyl ester cyclase